MDLSTHDTSTNVAHRMRHRIMVDLTPQNFCYQSFYCCYQLICTKAAPDFLNKILLF